MIQSKLPFPPFSPPKRRRTAVTFLENMAMLAVAVLFILAGHDETLTCGNGEERKEGVG